MVRFALLSIAVVVFAFPARAAEGESYGNQTVLADVTSGLLFCGAGLASNSNKDGLSAGFVVAGVATYLAGGPVVHLLHGNRGGAVRSGIVRVLLPVVATFVGAGIGGLVGGIDNGRYSDGTSKTGDQAATGGVIGFGAGVLAAIVVDAAAFAHEPAPEPPKVALAPLVGPDRTRGLALALKF